MNYMCVFLLCASFANCLNLSPATYKQHWQKWKSFYGKEYESEIHDNARFSIRQNNLKELVLIFQTKQNVAVLPLFLLVN